MKHLHKILLPGSLTTTPKHDEVITIESFETNSVQNASQMGHVAGYVTELVGCITYKKYPFTESEDVHAFRDYW